LLFILLIFFEGNHKNFLQTIEQIVSIDVLRALMLFFYAYNKLRQLL
jgi:hypothetical protein